MPLKTCSKDGSSGYKWGASGTCYPHDGTKDGIAAAKKRAIRQAIAIGGGKMPNENIDRIPADDVRLFLETFVEYAAEELPTVSLEGVEILSEGGPYFGTGSPPEGDFYDKAALERIAENNRQLAQAVKAFNKLGHDPDQRLLGNSGLVGDDELPAAGHLPGETFRVEQGADGKWKLLADVVKVPAKLAKLFEVGAYRTRSVELSRFTDGDDVYEPVVSALSWLGVKAPAVKSLDDVYALYAEGDVVWAPEDGVMDVMNDLRAQLAPPGGQPTRYWVEDVKADLTACIIRDWETNTAWVAPISMGADGEPTLSAAADWTPAEQAWVEAADETARGYTEAGAEALKPPADTNGVAGDGDKRELTDDQVQTLATAFGLEGEKDDLRAKVLDHMKGFTVEETPPAPTPPTPAPTPPTPAPSDPPQAAETARQMAELRADAELGKRAFEERRIERREAKLQRALGQDGGKVRIQPADLDHWRQFMDANEELATKALDALPELPAARTYGVDDATVPEGLTAEQVKAGGDEAWREYAAATGVVPGSAA